MSTSAPAASAVISTEHTDPVNAQILAVSEDRIKGFTPTPFQDIAAQSDLPLETVVERIRAMVQAGVIRRVRQTLLANKLAEGALVAWKVPTEKLDAAFDFLFKQDPFSGHVVLRSTDREVSGSDYRLWTTLKVPQGREISEHCDLLAKLIGAEQYLTMQAHGIFALGVGHVRRKTMEPGERADVPATMMTTNIAELDAEEWNVLLHLKGDLSVEEIGPNPWEGRAKAAGVSLEKFCEVAKRLDQKGVIGRFSTFLEHVKPSATGVRVTRFNALFHWKVPKGMEERAGGEVGRHPIMTHAYWREGGPRFGGVNIMGVIHGTDKEMVLAHKAAIDKHLAEEGIPLEYTNVFWGGRSEIKPSEISPIVYQEFHEKWKDANGPVV